MSVFTGPVHERDSLSLMQLDKTCTPSVGNKKEFALACYGVWVQSFIFLACVGKVVMNNNCSVNWISSPNSAKELFVLL